MDDTVFQYQEDDGSWQMLDTDANAMLLASSGSLVTVQKQPKKGWPMNYDIDLEAMTSTNKHSKTVRRLRKASMRIFEFDVSFKCLEAHRHVIGDPWYVVYQFEDDYGWKNFGPAANDEFLTNMRNGTFQFEWTHEWRNTRNGELKKTTYDINLATMVQTTTHQPCTTRWLRIVAIRDWLPPPYGPPMAPAA